MYKGYRQRKKTGLWGENSQRGGRGLTQTHSIFFSVFSNSGAYKIAKSGKNMWKFSNWGEGGRGSATWEFFPHNPVFSDHVPYERFWWGILCFTYIACSVYWLLFLGDAHHVVGNAGPKRFPTSRLGPHQQINLLNRDPLPKKVNISCQIVFYSFKRPCSVLKWSPEGK